MSPQRTLVEAAGVVDASGSTTPPAHRGGVLIETDGSRCTVLDSGEFDRVSSHPAARDARRTELTDQILMPAFVNAHTHLDLTTIGPKRYRALLGFTGWLGMIRRARRRGGDPAEATAIGCTLLRRGGVAAVGDIAGSFHTEPIEALRRSGLEGVSFAEAFGMGKRQGQAIGFFERLVEEDRPGRECRVGLGLQPHAPYSAGLDVYAAAADLHRTHGVPLATHLAESVAERRFVRDASGPLAFFIKRLGLWDETYLEQIGRGRRPVEHLAGVLHRARWLAVHVNDCSDEDLAILAETGTSVAYCPRASSYFHHERRFGAHRYREMIDAGINVALGTDSIVSLPRTESDRLSTLDEMRFLWRRDRTDADSLVAMATVNGARALGLDAERFTLAPGALAGLVALDVGGTSRAAPAPRRVLETDSAPRWVWPVEADDRRVGRAHGFGGD